MIVKVKKVDRNINWGAKDPKTGLVKSMYEGCKDIFICGLDATSGVVKTGLSEEDEKEFETLLGLEKGTLKKSSAYWTTYRISIPEDGLTLNTDNPKDALAYKVMSADPTIAKSLTEVRTNAKAEYVMTTESAEAAVKNTKRNEKAKAYAAFAKLTQAETLDALYMFGKDPSSMDFEIAQDRLGEIVDENPSKFLDVVGDKQFKDKVFFMKLIRAGVVRKHGTGTGTNMPLYFEDIMLGSGLEEAIVFFKDKENQQIALGIKKAYEAIR